MGRPPRTSERSRNSAEPLALQVMNGARAWPGRSGPLGPLWGHWDQLLTLAKQIILRPIPASPDPLAQAVEAFCKIQELIPFPPTPFLPPTLGNVCPTYDLAGGVDGFGDAGTSARQGTQVLRGGPVTRPEDGMKEVGGGLAAADDRSTIINGVDLGTLASERAQEPYPSGIAPVERLLNTGGESYYLILVVNRKAVRVDPLLHRADVAHAAALGPDKSVERSAGEGGGAGDVTAVVNAKSLARRTT